MNWPFCVKGSGMRIEGGNWNFNIIACWLDLRNSTVTDRRAGAIGAVYAQMLLAIIVQFQG